MGRRQPRVRRGRAGLALPGSGAPLGRLSWRAVDPAGGAGATAATPTSRGRPSAAEALAAWPTATWPIAVVADNGQRMDFADAVGRGGARVARLLDALVSEDRPPLGVEVLARSTPAGAVSLPLALVPLVEGVDAAGSVDCEWLEAVDRGRSATRRAVIGAGRGVELEAALHVTMLVATERLDPADDTDVAAHVASGARLWLLAGAVVSALAGAVPDPFQPWARLVTGGWWPIGPVGRRLVVSAAA